MSIAKIESRIVKFRVEQQAHGTDKSVEQASAPAVAMSEKIERPEMLLGSTYKVKTPVSDHAMYVTINDIVLNEGTAHEQRRPFEIFINSKNLDHFPWIVALTRILSAVFRKGGDIVFLGEELKAVFDPKGGYWQPGGRFMPSVIAELGYIIERHLMSIGLLKKPELEPAQQQLIAEKRAQYEARTATTAQETSGGYPSGAQLCGKCAEKAVILLDGCSVCLSCPDSKCQ